MKYINEAIIGNANILASIDDRSRLVRLYYPNIDYMQYVDEIITGIRINNEKSTLWMHDDTFTRTIEYVKNTNIVKNIYKLNYNEICIEEYIYIDYRDNILVRNIEVKNIPEGVNSMDYIYYSKLNTSKENMISSMKDNNMMIQYNHDACIGNIFSRDLYKYSINNSSMKISYGDIVDKDEIGMSNDMACDVNVYTKGSKNKDCKLDMFMIMGDNLSEVYDKINKVKLDRSILKENINYWETDLKAIKSKNEIVRRTYLLYKLLVNNKTGSVMAACEIDEELSKSGRYGYTWIRDNVFCLDGMLKLNMDEYIDKYFNVFLPMAQLNDGSFCQRYYTSGEMAPSWGIQNDEIALAVIGYNIYFKYLRDNKKNKKAKDLILKNANVITTAINYLKKHYKEETYTLWEMDKKIDIYTLEIIKKAFEDYTSLQKKILDTKEYYIDLLGDIKYINDMIKKEVSKEGYIIDVASLIPYTFLGVNTNKKYIDDLTKKIENVLFVDGLGYKRFENDNYMGGNVWSLSNLIMAAYYIKEGNDTKGNEILGYIENNVTKNNLIPEQIIGKDNYWVYGLSWAHSWYSSIVMEKDKK